MSLEMRLDGKQDPEGTTYTTQIDGSLQQGREKRLYFHGGKKKKKALGENCKMEECTTKEMYRVYHNVPDTLNICSHDQTVDI